MKYQVLLLAICFSLSAVSLSAQQRNRQHADEKTFAVGIAPFSLLLPGGKFNVRGEWAYAGNKSLSLLVSIPRPTAAPGLIGDNFDLEENAETSVNRFIAYGATLEHRFYFSQNALRGFYLAPYARYNNFALERTTENTADNYTTTVKGGLGGFGFGGSAGVQFRLGDYLTMDATIAGVDMRWMKGTFKYSTDNPETDLEAFLAEVKEAVEDIPFIGSNLDSAIDGNEVKVRTPGFLMPAYRFNLTVSYVF